MNGRGLRPLIAAATLRATRRPWRIACWHVGGQGVRRFLAGSGTAAASPMAQMRSWPCTCIVASTTMRPVSLSGSPSSATIGCGLTPAVHTHVRHGTTSPSESVAADSVTESSVVDGADLDAPPAQLVRRELGEVGRDLGHDAVARLDEDPAHALLAAARVQLDHVGREVLQLGEALEPGVARADEDVVQPLRALLRVLERLGRLERREQVVAQRDRVGQRLEADRVLGEAGHGQRPRDRAERERRGGRSRSARRGRPASARGSSGRRGRGR